MPLPHEALLDTSVLLRFFVEHDDELQTRAGLLRDAWHRDRIHLVLLDLSVYELVNVAVRRRGLSADRAQAAVSGIFALGAPIVAVDQALARDAAATAAATGLSGYDAAFLAAARRNGVTLVTADRRLAAEAGAISLGELSA